MPTHPAVAATTSTLTTYVFSALRQRVIDLQARGAPLFRLHIGDTWMEPMPQARAEAQLTSDNPGLHRYPPVQGIPELLDAIAAKVRRRTGVDVPREHTQVTAGATGGISVTIQALLDPGDEVLVGAPFWPLVTGIIASRGAVPVQVPLYDRLGSPDFDLEAALEAAITRQTAALYLNSPSNPCGAMFDADQVEAIARVVRRHGLWVISDEVYEDLYYTEAPPKPVWTYEALLDRTIVVHSMSKAYGMAGARVGYVHGPPEAMQAVRAVQTFQAYSTNQPLQLGAARALDEGDAWLASTRAAYATAARRTADALGLAMPPGGTFLFADARRWMRPGEVDAIPFLHRCIDRGIVLTAGAASGAAYGSHVRVCYTTLEPAQLDLALEVLREITQ